MENPALNVDRKLLGSSKLGHIQPRLLLLLIRSARPTLAEVPLAELSLGAANLHKFKENH